MQTLDRRLTALEQAMPPEKGLTIIRRFVVPGHLDAEIDCIEDGEGREWKRQPGETEAAFIDRAASETAGNSWGLKMLVGKTLETRHA
jgi:hypothetical protein